MRALVLGLITLLGTSLISGRVNADGAVQITASCAGSPPPVRSIHTVTIAGQPVTYVAAVGYQEVTSADQSAKICMFYTAYTVAPSAHQNRPVVFAFNGGPGSASVWLHLGLLGPQRVDMGRDGLTPPKGAPLVPNEFSILDTTDIVMIDAPSTGYSAIETGSIEKFFGVRNDYLAFSTFISTYVSTNNRHGDPVFILGESYGGIRGPLITENLQKAPNPIKVSGLILMSPALSMIDLDDDTADNNIASWTFFPSMATTSWFHKKIATEYQDLSVEALYQQARAFAFFKLRTALDEGNLIDPKERAATLAQMVQFSGIDASVIDSENLELDPFAYFADLLNSTHQVVGRYDGRYVEHRPSDPKEFADPSSDIPWPSYATNVEPYLTSLGWKSSFPYAIMPGVSTWPNDNDANGGAVVQNIASAFAQNPKLKVFVAEGYFDLACPMANVEYELSQMPGPANLRQRVIQKKYESGHMIYHNPVLMPRLRSHLLTFINAQR